MNALRIAVGLAGTLVRVAGGVIAVAIIAGVVKDNNKDKKD